MTTEEKCKELLDPILAFAKEHNAIVVAAAWIDGELAMHFSCGQRHLDFALAARAIVKEALLDNKDRLDLIDAGPEAN